MKPIAALFVLSIASTALAGAGSMPVDGFAAMVNNRVVTIGDVMAYVQPTDQSLRDQYTGMELQKKREEAYEAGLQSLIDRALILEDFKTQQGKLPERVINDRINELIHDKFKDDRIAFQQALVEEGITLDEWRDETRDRIVVSILRRQEVADKVKLSPDAALKLYESRKAKYAKPATAHLHVIVVHRKVADARDRAVMARGKILLGDDFEDVAKGYSDGPKADEGGDWGWLDPGTLRAELKMAANAAKVGAVSEVIETDDAYYVIRVDERHEAGYRSFAEVQPELAEELKQAEADRLYKDWMQRLRRKHYVQIF